MTFNNVHSWLTSVMRYPRGFYINGRTSSQPAQLLELYEFEACPFCRKVREVLSELDISYLNHPCARGSNQRETVIARGGKALFPYLVDPNTNTELYESEDIIAYLHKTYGTGRTTLDSALAPINTATSALASAFRRRGLKTTPHASTRSQPPQPLELYSFEISPYCRKAREALAELNLTHIVHNVAKNSTHRPELIARGGKMLVPYLIDPNTNTELYESNDIIAYLHKTYGS